MPTPAKGKPHYEITGLWVRTNPHSQELEVLVEHEGAWRVVFGDARSAVAGEGIRIPPTLLKVDDQTIDHCVHLGGLLASPFVKCELPSPSDGNPVHTLRCDLEIGHKGTVHHEATVDFEVTKQFAEWHMLRQERRADHEPRTIEGTVDDEIRIKRARRRR